MINSNLPDKSEIRLSRRLSTIAQQIPVSSRLADIGSDHALLPVYAVQQGIVRFAIAGEINAGPLEAARRQINEAGVGRWVFARLGDGLDIIEPGEVDTITIAGMGGSTMESILERGLPRLGGVKRLILQPNVGEAAVRKWMLRHGWLLTDETIVEEDGLFYEIFVSIPILAAEQEQANELLYSTFMLESITVDRDLQLLMGPHLMRKPNAVWGAKWREEILKRERIMAQMEQSDSPEAAEKRRGLKAETERIREVLACLHMDKP